METNVYFSFTNWYGLHYNDEPNYTKLTMYQKGKLSEDIHYNMNTKLKALMYQFINMDKILIKI